MSSTPFDSNDLLQAAIRREPAAAQPVGRTQVQLFRTHALTAREIEILQLIATGLTNTEIGAKLFISSETVKSHVRHILAKLGARTRAHAVALGVAYDDIQVDLVT